MPRVAESDNPQNYQSSVFTSETLSKADVKSMFNKSSMKTLTNIFVKMILFIGYNSYLGYAIHYNIENEKDIDWCGGLGFLILLTSWVYILFFYFKILKPQIIKSKLKIKIPRTIQRICKGRLVRNSATALVPLSIIVFLIFDTTNDRYRLVSAGGLFFILLLGFIFSKSRSKIVWRHVLWGMCLQFIFGLIIMRWEYGRVLFNCVGSKFDTFLGYTDAGSSFVFGYLVDQKPFLPDKLGNNSLAQKIAEEINAAHAVSTIVVFKTLSTVYFFSFLVSMLYYLGYLQCLVIKIGWLLQVSVGTTACESVNAAANIFMGQATAPFLIKPYISEMTLSELHAVMTGGFATIAGTVLAAYVSFGVSAAHLVSASVMSAPAALAFSKLFYPETEKSKTKAENISIEPPIEANLLDAATQGASSAGILVVHVTAIVVAFIAFMAFINSVVGFLGALVGFDYITFDLILGKLFMPLTFVMGVEWKDCEKVARLIGVKTILNEFIAYQQLGVLIENGELSQRSILIATYALCGFANPGSIGVQLATLSSIAPDRKSDFSKVAFRAFISGTAACLLTACVAGILNNELV